MEFKPQITDSLIEAAASDWCDYLVNQVIMDRDPMTFGAFFEGWMIHQGVTPDELAQGIMALDAQELPYRDCQVVVPDCQPVALYVDSVEPYKRAARHG
ncbi:MAG: hypothetical protein KMY53_16075 [Desulfarculus sp.]|nr:hypothetical protein [Pseudomonadota bacterium]MBV1715467.1 hypothetical protein [Desulfarculus sp.]MBU4576227.1 hypothetical protein [Pseudomonadota bacterium]MBU4599265.1 hypothetical protein [Pseudomonadota bacterium]MBV1739686.1 hypothetical protein [Desulfarculus sp.]